MSSSSLRNSSLLSHGDDDYTNFCEYFAKFQIVAGSAHQALVIGRDWSSVPWCGRYWRLNFLKFEFLPQSNFPLFHNWGLELYQIALLLLTEEQSWACESRFFIIFWNSSKNQILVILLEVRRNGWRYSLGSPTVLGRFNAAVVMGSIEENT